jgi:phage nucleotide-binding protein
MALQITNTRDEAARFLKVLVHAPAGSGKTRLCATTGGRTLILSAEAGLLSLRGHDIDVFTIKTIDDLEHAYNELKADTVYDWICLDSISEVSEVILQNELKETKDPRKAYGEMQNKMNWFIRAFRDIEKNVYMSSKQDRVKDEVTGQMLYGPMMSGQKLGASMPYFFDLVLALQTWKDQDGVTQRALQTVRDGSYEAKDRSGVLDPAEPPDLSLIYRKIINNDFPQLSSMKRKIEERCRIYDIEDAISGENHQTTEEE